MGRYFCLSAALTVLCLVSTCSSTATRPSSVPDGTLSSIAFLKLHERLKTRSEAPFVVDDLTIPEGEPKVKPECLHFKTPENDDVEITSIQLHNLLEDYSRHLTRLIRSSPKCKPKTVSVTVKCGGERQVKKVKVHSKVKAYAPKTYGEALWIAYGKAPERLGGFDESDSEYLTWSSYIYKIDALSDRCPFYLRLVGGTKRCEDYDRKERAKTNAKLLRVPGDAYNSMFEEVNVVHWEVKEQGKRKAVRPTSNTKHRGKEGVTSDLLRSVFTGKPVNKGGALGMLAFAQVISESRRNHLNGVVSLLAYDLMGAHVPTYADANLLGATSPHGSTTAYFFFHPMSHAKSMKQVGLTPSGKAAPTKAEESGGVIGTNAYYREVQFLADWLIHNDRRFTARTCTKEPVFKTRGPNAERDSMNVKIGGEIKILLQSRMDRAINGF